MGLELTTASEKKESKETSERRYHLSKIGNSGEDYENVEGRASILMEEDTLYKVSIT